MKNSPAPSQNIESHLTEKRVFKPGKTFSKAARISSMEEYREMYKQSVRKPDKFWAGEASELLWRKKWKKVCDWKPPFAQWFVGGQLNVSENCLDRHVAAGKGDKVAFHWEGEPGDTRTITYADLQDEVCRAANALTDLGVQAGECVAVEDNPGGVQSAAAAGVSVVAFPNENTADQTFEGASVQVDHLDYAERRRLLVAS